MDDLSALATLVAERWTRNESFRPAVQEPPRRWLSTLVLKGRVMRMRSSSAIDIGNNQSACMVNSSQSVMAMVRQNPLPCLKYNNNFANDNAIAERSLSKTKVALAMPNMGPHFDE